MGGTMPQFPKTAPKPDAAFIADMLGEMEKLARPRWRLLAYLIGMARLEAEGKVTGKA